MTADPRIDSSLQPAYGPAPARPYGPFGNKQRDRYVDSSDQVIGELR